MLTRKRRLRLEQGVTSWRAELLSLGLTEEPLDGETGVAAEMLEGFHGDPADRMIVATALQTDAMLLTADEKILAWPGPLRRLDACR
jgi:PIN domain nuclease of toxin-antitoxin system